MRPSPSAPSAGPRRTERYEGRIWPSWTHLEQSTQHRYIPLVHPAPGVATAVVSQWQNEVDAFKKKGLDIAPHRLRMVKEDLDTKFKDPKDPLRPP